MIVFDLQLFKGDSTTVVDNSYKPTEAEIALQNLSLDYARTVSPQAKNLNSTAQKILANSLGAVQVDFNGLNNKAQNQINTSNANNLALANGKLPTALMDNISGNVNRGLENSMGSMLNNLANNGVLNSSVTSDGINRLSKTASDTISEQMQNYMGILHNFNNNNIGNAAAGITTASAAQEAAQTPALNLWNASLGLNGANTSALGAVAGKMGQSKSSTTMKGGGGFLGGLFGGLF